MHNTVNILKAIESCILKWLIVCRVVYLNLKKSLFRLEVSGWAASSLNIAREEAGLGRWACKNYVRQRLRRRVTWWLAGEMAAPGESGASGGGGSTEEAFMTFYSEVNHE